MAIIVFLLTDKVFGCKRLAGFEGAVSRVSRDLASFEILFSSSLFLVQFFIFLAVETLFSRAAFCYRGRFSLILSLTLTTL